MVVPPGLGHVGCGIGPERKVRPIRGNSPSDRKDSTDFKSPQESLRRCSASQLRSLRFYPARSALTRRAPSTYHGLENGLWKRGHFYFAENRTFLFCVDMALAGVSRHLLVCCWCVLV